MIYNNFSRIFDLIKKASHRQYFYIDFYSADFVEYSRGDVNLIIRNEKINILQVLYVIQFYIHMRTLSNNHPLYS